MSAWDLVEEYVECGRALDDVPDSDHVTRRYVHAEKAARAAIERLEREHAALQIVCDAWKSGRHCRTAEDLVRHISGAMTDASSIMEATDGQD